MAATKPIRLPPFCGEGLTKQFFDNPYQRSLLKARRLRVCGVCKALGPCNDEGIYICQKCHTRELSQVLARKAYRRIGIVGGRRSGKTQVGAFAAREEVVVPNGLGWVCGPTFKDLMDSTMPAFFRLLPPSWVKHWAPQQMDLTLINNHLIQFRSLDDPERGRGPGPTWSWWDEAQKIRERAWDVFRPSLTENLGNTIFTFTPNGFDWTWRRLWRPIHGPFDVGKAPTPGFWMARCLTIDNPWIRRYAMDEVEEARATMPAQMFRQEYEADFVSFVGNVYDWEEIQPLILHEDGLKRFIPEWPRIDPSRTCVVGLSAEPGKPVGAVLLVLTEFGIVVAREYVSEHRAIARHFNDIEDQVLTVKANDGSIVEVIPARWSADEDQKTITVEANRRAKPIGIIPAEHYLITGVQRVHSWMFMKRLWFADTCGRTLDQMREYRWADATADDDAPTDRVLKKNDELPNAIRFGLLSWPTLPASPEMPSGRDLSAMPERAADEIRRLAEYEREAEDGGHDVDEKDKTWPLGDFFGGDASQN